MSIPGFTAEASLRGNRGQYRMGRTYLALGGNGQVVPQQWNCWCNAFRCCCSYPWGFKCYPRPQV
jgi:hypothetical protein